MDAEHTAVVDVPNVTVVDGDESVIASWVR